jgi:hypothetical protein
MRDAAQPLLLRLNWCHIQWTYESIVEGQRPRPVSRKDFMQCTFHELHCPLATIMCQTTSCFLVAKSNIHCGDRQGQRGITLFTYRPNNKAPAIRCRIHQLDGIGLASNISIANMPHKRANQIPTPFIPFSHGEFGSLPSASRSLEFGGWSVSGPKLGRLDD